MTDGERVAMLLSVATLVYITWYLGVRYGAQGVVEYLVHAQEAAKKAKASQGR